MVLLAGAGVDMVTPPAPFSIPEEIRGKGDAGFVEKSKSDRLKGLFIDGDLLPGSGEDLITGL